MKKLFILFTLLLGVVFFSSISAQTVTSSQAEMACKRFLLEHYPGAMDKMPQVTLEETFSEGSTPCVYRFSIEHKGFVLVSGSQSVMPVLAYSFDDNFELIPPVANIMAHYKQVVCRTEKGEAPAAYKSVMDWKRYLSDEYTPTPCKTPNHGPLLTTRWNQNRFYNTYCPWDVASGSWYDYRVPNGCVACAATQIMNYHRYPEHGIGATTYIPAGYPRQTVYFNQHKYNWDAMANEPESYACEIAKLTYHFGVAIQMGYTADGSGASSSEARDELKQKFLYDQSITSYYRDYYQDSSELAVYLNILKNEINLHRPIYQSGCNQQMNSCHAYVVDGYDADDRFSVNYGWGGSSNGFYAIDNFVSGSTHWDYSSEAVVNIFPSGAYPATYCQGHQRNTASFGYVADGSPTAKPYQVNPDCSWMVAAPDAHSYTFSFDRLDLNPDVDFVTIYNGPTVESGVKVVLTGSTVPTTRYTVDADSVLITFTSNGSASENTDYYGFLISYTSQVSGAYCTPINNVSDWTGFITDGSGEGTPYRPQSNCTWNISLNFISGYAFTFQEFNLGYGDFVDVYNASTNPPTLYQRFDIYNQPGADVFNVTFKKMKVNFVADNWDQKDGFKMGYYAIAGIDDHSGINDISVYPNPASSNIFIDFNMEDATNVTCRLLDATGKLIQVDNIEANAGGNKHTINVSALSAGFYMLELLTPNGKTIRKVMVQ